MTFPIIKKYRFNKLNTVPQKVGYDILVMCAMLFTAMCYFKGADYIFPVSWQSNKTVGIIYYTIAICIIIFANIQIAFFLENIRILQQIGQKTLVLCGTEDLIKRGIGEVLSIGGLSMAINNPFAGLVLVAICLLLGNRISKFFEIVLPKIFKPTPKIAATL